MKKDKYLKFILTIIAICLIWICVRDIRIGSHELHAINGSLGVQDVRIVGVKIGPGEATLSWPIPVEIRNISKSPLPETK